MEKVTAIIAIIVLNIFFIKYFFIKGDKLSFPAYFYFCYIFHKEILEVFWPPIDYIMQFLILVGVFKLIFTRKLTNIKFSKLQVLFIIIVILNGFIYNIDQVIYNPWWKQGLLNLIFNIIAISYYINEITNYSKLNTLFKVATFNGIVMFIYALIDRVIFNVDRVGQAYNCNFFAQNVAISLVIYFYFQQKKISIKSVLYYIMMLISIFLSGSKSVVLSLIIIGVIFFIGRIKSKKVYLLSFIGIILVATFYMGITVTNGSYDQGLLKYVVKKEDTSRIDLWKYTYDVFINNPWKGTGYNCFRAMWYERQMVTHNDYLRIMVELGVFGIIVFMMYIVCQFKKILKLTNGKLVFLYSAMILALNFSLTHNYVAKFMFWFLISLPMFKVWNNDLQKCKTPISK